MFARLKSWARRILRDLVALYLAGRDDRTPLAARVLALGLVAYVLSPVDLIPDFLPLIGQLDELILVPAGIALAVRLIPAELMSEFRIAAAQYGRLPSSRAGLGIVIALWICGAALLAGLLLA